MLVLTLLRDEPTYGYQLVTRLRECGLSDVSTGTVYPVLTRLERDGQLASSLVASELGPARKYYQPTETGLTALIEARRRWDALGTVVHAVVKEQP